MKKLLIAVSLCMLLTESAYSLPLESLKGNGAFLQKSSLNNQLAWSSAFDWFIVDSTIMKKDLVKTIDKPLVMSYSGQSLTAIKTLITRYSTRLVAVVWEYGPKNMVGLVKVKDKRVKAESDLSEARTWANQHGLPFGVITVSGPDGSLKLNGVSYPRLFKFADFVMPCLYSQWWGHRENTTRWVYAKEVKLADVPVIPLVNLYAASKKLMLHEMPPDDLVRNYYGLDPAPRAMAYYSLDHLDDDLMSAIISVGQTMEEPEPEDE
jgi:hypothetical protein